MGVAHKRVGQPHVRCVRRVLVARLSGWTLAAIGAVLFAAARPAIAQKPAASGGPSPATQPPVGDTALVFDRVTVIDVRDGRRLAEQRVVIRDNRIHALGPTRAVKLPRGARVVDARGKYLIPGLWDMHAHLGDPWFPDPYVGLAMNHRLLLANGVTGLREAGTDLLALDRLVQSRRAILVGTQAGPPRQVFSGPMINGAIRSSSQCGQAYAGGPRCLYELAHAGRVVDSLKAAGADMIKTYELSREMYLAVAAAARRAGLPFGGHATGPDQPISLAEASDSGAVLIDHVLIDSLSDCGAGSDTAALARCQARVERLRRNGTWAVPTLTVIFGYIGGDNSKNPVHRLLQLGKKFWTDSTAHRGKWLRGQPPSLRWRNAQRAGFPMLAGSDLTTATLEGGLAGFSLHMELALLVEAGLSPLAALQAATLNPAKMLQATDSLGTVAAGKLADLVLLDADPLADITNTTMIRAVVANGRYYDRAALDRLLAEVRATDGPGRLVASQQAERLRQQQAPRPGRQP